MTPPVPDKPWLKISEAAARAQVSVATLRRAVRQGRVRAVRVNGARSLRFTPAFIDAWLMACEVERP